MRYKANWLWPHKDGSIEEAAYEFANGKTTAYQKQWLNILIERAKKLQQVEKEHIGFCQNCPSLKGCLKLKELGCLKLKDKEIAEKKEDE